MSLWFRMEAFCRDLKSWNDLDLQGQNECHRKSESGNNFEMLMGILDELVEDLDRDKELTDAS